MELKEILTKVVKGEELSEDEKKFLGDYDEQTMINSAAASARKKAEKERDDYKSQLEALQDQQKKGDNKNQSEVQLLKERIDTLEQKNKDADAKLAAVDKAEKITSAFASAKIKPASGVSQKLFQSLQKLAFDDIDVNDEDALKQAVENFKKDNPAIIADDTLPGGGRVADPSFPTKAKPKDNPYSTDHWNLTKQFELEDSDPEMAAQLKQDAQGAQS